jgi:hypothetical protein
VLGFAEAVWGKSAFSSEAAAKYQPQKFPTVEQVFDRHPPTPSPPILFGRQRQRSYVDSPLSKEYKPGNQRARRPMGSARAPSSASDKRIAGAAPKAKSNAPAITRCQTEAEDEYHVDDDNDSDDEGIGGDRKDKVVPLEGS